MNCFRFGYAMNKTMIISNFNSDYVNTANIKTKHIHERMLRQPLMKEC